MRCSIDLVSHFPWERFTKKTTKRKIMIDMVAGKFHFLKADSNQVVQVKNFASVFLAGPVQKQSSPKHTRNSNKGRPHGNRNHRPLSLFLEFFTFLFSL